MGCEMCCMSSRCCLQAGVVLERAGVGRTAAVYGKPWQVVKPQRACCCSMAHGAGSAVS
jgi:hypothetical protein